MSDCKMKENEQKADYGKIKLTQLIGIYFLAIVCAAFLRVKGGEFAVLLSGMVFYILPSAWIFWKLKKEHISLRLWTASIQVKALEDTFFVWLLFIGVSAAIILLEALLFQNGEIAYAEIEWQRVLVLAVLAPIAEEFICRGMILQRFLKKYSVKKAVWLSALLFYAIHFNILNVLTIFVGVMFGVLMIKHCSLYLTIAVHFTWNLLLQFKPWMLETLRTMDKRICILLMLFCVLAAITGLVKSIQLYRYTTEEYC
ncbi:CPBP family intramembrane glutamic endopeptidase [Sinanaerobacter sp. ZZT-01]|uniref:CPBP family intramembrane glutamic endopeptidase n=1 Tax=Sinanaerobacter sp. ZZT-01 TaxID=3111540 RepID=UPI002D7A2455|nr:CPBP family intramembrane glutamic endopeptidase [Sinanaerobacter sp. ZZT-01]WRR92430.1 CPBP family intramembrane glutamic endopeptidase [Sinanaerobacter sp. ZZT-01]